MSTQQQIDDPGQWRVGDEATVTFEDGAILTGRLRERFGSEMWVGDRAVRYPNGESIQAYGSATVTVTRTVEPIPEPTEPWALVKFADGAVMTRMRYRVRPWTEDGRVGWPWEDVTDTHGAPVAVSLPRWSDEADGLRARVEKLLDDPPLIVSGIYRDLELSPMARGGMLRHEPDATPGAGACPGDNLTAWFDRLRALLAEGGEA